MKRWKWWCLPAVLLALFSLNGCAKTEIPPEPLIINVYAPASGYVGEQGGWYGYLLEKKFNITLNFLDTAKEEALAEADLILCPAQNGNPFETASELLEEGLLLDMKPYLEKKDIWAYESQIRYWNEALTEKGIYVIPTQMSRMSAEVPTEEFSPQYGLYINWEAYRKAGYPQIRDKEELLEVMSLLLEQPAGQTKEAAPETAGMQRTGISLYREKEGDLLKQLADMVGIYGYETQGFVMYRQSAAGDVGLLDRGVFLIQENPLSKAVKWLWEANRQGILDADSRSQSRQDVLDKYKAGLVCVHTDPKLDIDGYELAPLEDMEIVSYGCNPKGTLDVFAAVGSRAKQPERVMDFIDWLYSAEGIMDSATHTAVKTAGPIELTWTVKEGLPRLTEFGERVLTGEDAILPDGWGGGTWQEGYCRLGLEAVVPVEVTPSGYLYNYTLWDSVKEDGGAVPDDWTVQMEAESPMAYLIRKGRLSVLPAYQAPGGTLYEDTEEVAALRTKCGAVIEDMLWEIIYAPDEESYETLWEQMVKEAEAAGYEQIKAYDMGKVRLLREAREEAAR